MEKSIEPVAADAKEVLLNAVFNAERVMLEVVKLSVSVEKSECPSELTLRPVKFPGKPPSTSISSASTLSVDAVHVTELNDVTGFIVDLDLLIDGGKRALRIECPQFKPRHVCFDGIWKNVR